MTIIPFAIGIAQWHHARTTVCVSTHENIDDRDHGWVVWCVLLLGLLGVVCLCGVSSKPVTVYKHSEVTARGGGASNSSASSLIAYFTFYISIIINIVYIIQ